MQYRVPSVFYLCIDFSKIRSPVFLVNEKRKRTKESYFIELCSRKKIQEFSGNTHKWNMEAIKYIGKIFGFFSLLLSVTFMITSVRYSSCFRNFSLVLLFARFHYVGQRIECIKCTDNKYRRLVSHQIFQIRVIVIIINKQRTNDWRWQ